MMRLPLQARGLIVSCQAYPGDPLYGGDIMARIAKAAERSGAVAIRANGSKDIRQIKSGIRLPVIGLNKRPIEGSDIYITPEIEDVDRILQAGADIVAIDVTDRENRLSAAGELIRYIHAAGAYVMADVSTIEEGKQAAALGADYVSTTLSGYTAYSAQQEGPDFELIGRLSREITVPVVAEGRIWGTEEAVEALRQGATYVVVGSAITRPQLIAERFVDRMNRWLNGDSGQSETKSEQPIDKPGGSAVLFRH